MIDKIPKAKFAFGMCFLGFKKYIQKRGQLQIVKELLPMRQF